MKIKLILLKKNLKIQKNVYLDSDFLLFFIEKVFFVLSDLLNLKKLSNYFNFFFINLKKNLLTFFCKDFIICQMDLIKFYCNDKNFFDLFLYSKNIKGFFNLNKKSLINPIIEAYLFIKIIVIFIKNYVYSISYILIFIKNLKFFKNLN